MEEQTHMTVSERMFAFIDARKDKSAAGLAKLLGVSTGQTTSWRQRNCDPPVKYLPQICEYLGVSIAFLVTGEEAKVDLAKFSPKMKLFCSNGTGPLTPTAGKLSEQQLSKNSAVRRRKRDLLKRTLANVVCLSDYKNRKKGPP